jgi:signal recognition particle subunit SRP54
MFESLTQGLGDAVRRFFGPGKLTEKNVEEGIRAVRTALLEADVRFEVARDFIARVKERALGADVISGVDASQQIVKVIADELTVLLGGEPGQVLGGEEATQRVAIRFAERPPTVVMMVGLQGSGKTTTTAKLARFLKAKGRRPLLVAADVQRPAAVDQLKVLGRSLNVEVFAADDLPPPQICANGVAHAKVKGFDVVLLDTAGRLHIDAELMAELREVRKCTSPHEIFFVCDAMTGQDAVSSAKEFNDQLEVSGVILTKLDGDTRGGAAMSIRAVTGKPIRFVGVGEKIEDLEPFYPERMATRILGMGDVVSLVEKAQSVIDEKEAERAAEKMLAGKFTLEDMYQQLRMIQKMGPLKKVFGMLPGMGQMRELMDQVDDRHFARMQAMFTSMTPKERKHPELLDNARRRRIANGSGNSVDAVNALLKQFRDMQRLMKQLRGGGPGGLAGLGNLLGGGGPPSPGGGSPKRPGGGPKGGGFPGFGPRRKRW